MMIQMPDRPNPMKPAGVKEMIAITSAAQPSHLGSAPVVNVAPAAPSSMIASGIPKAKKSSLSIAFSATIASAL